MSRTCVRGEGKTKQEAIDDLTWRVRAQAGVLPSDQIYTYRDGGRWYAAYRMPDTLIGARR